jgi:putative drug exporter of the RND superfamily
MSALARWCYQHRIAVVGLWVALLLALGGASAAVGTNYSEEFSLPGTESTKALELLQKQLPDAAGDSDQIVVHVDSGKVQDEAVRTEVSSMLAKVEKLPEVASVTSMYSKEGATQISADGRTAYATVNFDKTSDKLDVANVTKVIDTAQAARGDGLQVELGGQAINEATQAPPGSSEVIGIVAAAIILFFAFGSLLGMMVPLIVAMAGLGGGLLGVGLLSHSITLSSVAPTLAALIGLGVGIDYALFIVTRHRNGLQAGLSPEDSAVRALNTSGRAVLFAGGTVVIALLGLLVLRLNFLNGLGIGSAVTVAFTILSALTLTPAMLGFFGNRLISKKQRRALAADGPRVEAGPVGVWARWASLVEKRKAVFSVVAIAIVVALAVPTLSIRLGSSDAGNNKADSTTRKAYDLLAAGFGPGSNGPLQLVAELKTPADAQALDGLIETVKTTEGVASVQKLPSEPGAEVAIAMVIPTSAPQDVATDELIDRLRTDVVPAAEKGSSMQVYVGGGTAIFKDFAKVLTDKLPLFLGVVIALGFLLLMIAFRSLLVPLTAAVMNVVAAAASFGVIVAIFQWGWGAELLNIGREGPVEAFVPVIMLAILFGLSMDYQVFLVSRMHEEWVRTKDNERSVRIGQGETGRVITAAALIMIFVFGAFVLQGERVIAEFGLGLAVAVAIDAFVIRTVLVPALMHLFGSANWWLPGWLDRILPHFSVEGDIDEPTPVPASGPGPDRPRTDDDELISSPRG